MVKLWSQECLVAYFVMGQDPVWSQHDLELPFMLVVDMDLLRIFGVKYMKLMVLWIGISHGLIITYLFQLKHKHSIKDLLTCLVLIGN